jgi:type IV pilus assembly protein PilV
MVEMLVALVVLAVGMLGVASLFGISLHSGSSAITRMQAVNLATDLADRIRANRRAGNGANNAYGGAAANNSCTGAAAVSCTPAQMAADDLYHWQRQLSQTIVGAAATGTVVVTPGTPQTYTITVNWNERAGTQVVTLPYQLQIQVPTS